MTHFKNYFFIFLYTIFSITLLNATTKIELTDAQINYINKNQKIIVGAEEDWAPFDFVEDGVYKGIAKDYLDLIEAKTGLKFEYVIDKWPKLIEKIKNEEIKLLPALAKSSKREEFMLFTDKYLTTRDYLYAQDTNKSIKTIDDIKNKKMSIVKGYIQADIIKEKHPSVEIIYVDTLLEAIDQVVTGKADFMVANIALMNYYTRRNGITNIAPKFHFGYKWNKLHMGVSKNSSILRDIIEKALNSITEEEKNKILNRWFDQAPNKFNSKLNLSQEEINFIESKRSIVIANEYDWIPFDFNEEGNPKGYVIDYIKLLSEKIGLEVVFVTDKWGKLIERFKSGEIDILPVISKNKKREEFMHFSKSYLTQTLILVTKESVNDIINLDDLNNKKVGLMKDWNSTNIIRKNYPDMNIIEFESLSDIFDAIKNNFVDATIQNKYIANYYINKDYRGYLKAGATISIPTHKSDLYIGIKKDLSILENLINKAIKSVSKDEIESLEKKWITYGRNISFTKEELEFIDKNIINTIATSNWAPFNFLEDNSLKGLGVDFFEYIKDQAKLKTNQNTTNKFLDALTSIKEKKNDMILATTKTKDREEYSIFSDIFLTTPIGIVTLQDKNYIANGSQLLGKRVAVGKNFSAHKLLEEKYPNMDFVFVYSVEQGLEYLSQNQVYAYVDIMPVLTYNIEKLGYTNIKVSGQTGIDFNLRIMIRDDYPILQSIINKVINNMSEEEKQTIMDKWLKVKFEPNVDYSLVLKVMGIFFLILIFVLYKNRQLKEYQRKLEKTTKELESSLSNFKALMNLNIAGVLILNNKKITYLNDEVVNIFGYSSKTQLLDKTIDKIIINSPENNNVFALLEHLPESYEFSGRKENGSSLPILVKAKKINFNNRPSYIVSIVDLSDIKNKEELMVQQSKMASLGEMIGNIAHQWRQPLSSISTAASGLKLQKEFDQLTDEVFDNSLDNITKTTQFLSQTIDDFQNYIKENKLKKEFDISGAIMKVLSLMKGSFVNNFITLEKSLDSIIIESYENELNQALLNILSNSKDALRNVNEGERYIKISSYKRDKNAIIEIVDSGGGIDEKIVNKVFEPYFTTKHKSQGTGLGLYMTHKIITDSMGGEIIIKNCSYKDYPNCTKVFLRIPLKD